MQARSFAAALIVSAGVIASASAQDVPKTNCDSNDAWREAWRDESKRAADAGGPGPFRLSALHCQTLGNAGSPGTVMPFTRIEPVIVSPDISWIAAQNGNDSYNRGVAVAPLSARLANVVHDDALDFFNGWVARGNFIPRKTMRWSADSRTLWSAMQERATCPCPGSWAAKPAVGPVRPIAVENGVLRELPATSHAAGTLDALLWAEDGRALALFGARGRYYRPAVANPDPAIAFIDAARGRVIESLPLRDVVAAAGGADDYLRATEFLGHSIINAEVAGLRDARLRAFLRIGKYWVVWTQGTPLRVLPDPYPAEDPSSPTPDIETAISADGARILIIRQHHRVTSQCATQHGPCTVGPPVDGVLAALHDIESGRAIWTYRVRITVPGSDYPVPALSDDGRYALIGLPPSDRAPENSVALISARDGTVQQVFRTSDYKVAMGFGRGSQRMWIHDRGLTAVYALQ
jgi:hypothetical protein